MNNILKKASERIVQILEQFFYWYGLQVSRHPLPVILICLVGTGLMGIGIINYQEENNAFKLWIPDNSDFFANYAWLEKNAPPDIRHNSLMMVSEGSNILSPESLSHMQTIHKTISETVTSTNNITWDKICYRIPVITHAPVSTIDPFTIGFLHRYNITSAGFPFDIDCLDDPICNMLTMNDPWPTCLEKSLLEVWGYDFDYMSLTQEDIIGKINSPELISQVFKTSLNITDYLGGNIKMDLSGNIVSAEAAFMEWYGQLNTSSILDAGLRSAGTGQASDPNSLEWEATLRDILMEDQNNLPSSVKTFIKMARSFADISGESINNDANILPIGFMIVFMYVMFMLGKFNCVEIRTYLGLAGLACIGLAILFMYGFCSAVGLFLSPMHNIIPFLILGIGIDDMFVIMQCFDNLGDERTDDYTKNIAKTMKHAGVAITVTSITDFIVFAIGASTVLPALKSFCLWCGVGILACYFYQTTVFTACLALDCMRINCGRNGFIPFFKHKSAKEGEETGYSVSNDLSLSKRLFGYFGKFLISVPGTVVAILLTCGLLGGGILGCTRLEQEFDPTWFLPQDSYVSKWFAANKDLFPSEGEVVTIYFTEMDWDSDMERIDHLVTQLKMHTNIIQKVDEWHTPYKNRPAEDDGLDILGIRLNDNTFYGNLTKFLCTPEGISYERMFNWIDKEELVCGEPAPHILLSTISFTHTRFTSREEYIPAMNTIKDIIGSCNFTGNVFPITQEYATWETDEVITRELLQNLGLALGCILIITLILLANVTGSVLVLLTVLLTVVNICGYMHFWGLTIDVVSSIMIIISIGLCVDYSAHICHTFLTLSGTRKERSIGALVNMGPAVLNGGVSTTIAFILLAPSQSHVFSTFFKIFFLVVVFGLFHGLVLQPVLLALLGPLPYGSATPAISIKSNKDIDSERAVQPVSYGTNNKT